MNQFMNLSQHQSLQQTLSPQMIQSLKLLQVTALQLEQVIKQELEINPVLEETADEILEEEIDHGCLRFPAFRSIVLQRFHRGDRQG